MTRTLRDKISFILYDDQFTDLIAVATVSEINLTLDMCVNDSALSIDILKNINSEKFIRNINYSDRIKCYGNEIIYIIMS